MKTDAQILGEAIEKDRVQSGKSQDDVAREVGVTQQALSGWEAGTSLPRNARLAGLVRVFGIESHTLNAIRQIFPKNWNNRISEALTVEAIADEINKKVDVVRHRVINDKGEAVEIAVRLPKERHRAWRSVAGMDPPSVEETQEKYGSPLPNMNDDTTWDEMRFALHRAALDLKFASQMIDRSAAEIQKMLDQLEAP